MKTKLVKSIASCSLLACALVSLVAAMALGTSDTARAAIAPQPCGVYTIVEGIDFSGDGTLVSPFATVSINGTIIRSSGAPGSYTVAADCTGTLTFTGGASFDIFVNPNGKQLWMIQTGPAAVPAVFEGTVTQVSS